MANPYWRTVTDLLAKYKLPQPQRILCGWLAWEVLRASAPRVQSADLPAIAGLFGLQVFVQADMDPWAWRIVDASGVTLTEGQITGCPADMPPRDEA
jgi:hypothetical protein